MAKTIEEIAKMPPRERIAYLRQQRKETGTIVPSAPKPSLSTPSKSVTETKEEITQKSLKESYEVAAKPHFYRLSERYKYLQAQKRFREDIGGFPKGTAFVRTKEGYEARIPEKARLEWIKHHLKETEKLPSGIQQLGEVQTIGTSTVMGVSRIPSDVLGKGAEFEKGSVVFKAARGHWGLIGFAYTWAVGDYEKRLVEGAKKARWGIHYPSALDVAFEPVGLAPKGTTELLGKYPVGTVVGGVAGETAIAIALSTALKPVVTKAKAGYAVLRGKRGMVRGLRLAPGGYKPVRATTEFGEEIFKRVPYKKLERVWMTPAQAARAKQTLIRLTTKKGVDISFPTVKTVEGGRQVLGIIQREGWKLKGIIKPRLVHEYYGLRYGRQITAYGKIFKGIKTVKLATDVKQYGGLVDVGRAKIPMLESEARGMRVYSKTGEFLGFKQPALLQYPLAKKTISRRIPGFLAVGELESPKVIFRSIPSSAKKLGMIPGAITIPSVAPKFSLAYGFRPLTGVLPIHKLKTERITIPAIKKERAFAHLPVTKVATATITTPITIDKVITAQLQRVDFKPLLKYDYKRTTISKPRIAPYVMPKVIVSPFLFPHGKLYGRGRLFYGDEWWQKRYKFRKFYVPTLGKLLKGVKIT